MDEWKHAAVLLIVLATRSHTRPYIMHDKTGTTQIVHAIQYTQHTQNTGSSTYWKDLSDPVPLTHYTGTTHSKTRRNMQL